MGVLFGRILFVFINYHIPRFFSRRKDTQKSSVSLVQSSEIPFSNQLNVDFVFGLWYAEYVGRALGRSSFLPVPGKKKRPLTGSCQAKEMTLDCLFFRTSFSVKGHFCSFLLSNIIGYLTFFNLDICLFWSFPVLIFKNQFALTLSVDKIFEFFTADQFRIWFFGFCPLDSWCLESFFWSVEFSPDLNDFFSLLDSGYFCLFILLVYLIVPPVSFGKKESLFDSFLISFWFLWFDLPLVMFSHLYDFFNFIKILFTFFSESSKSWIFVFGFSIVNSKNISQPFLSQMYKIFFDFTYYIFLFGSM